MVGENGTTIESKKPTTERKQLRNLILPIPPFPLPLLLHRYY